MHTISRGRPRGLPFGESRPPDLRIGFHLFEALRRIAETLLTWQERAAQRSALTSLDERMLRDIGLTRADVLMEAERPFWRA